jgi:hypothetical protein
MKIVDLKTFLELPENTLYSKYGSCVFGDLQIKMETTHNDFFTQQICDSIECSGSDEYFDKLEAAQHGGVSLKMDFDIMGRDGLFENDQLFAVWENEDVEALIERLQECVIKKDALILLNTLGA